MGSSLSFAPSRPAEETVDKLSRWKKRWDDNFIGMLMVDVQFLTFDVIIIFAKSFLVFQ